jgi:hypothetical protein
MANGLVRMIFSKADGSVSSFTLASLPTTNLIDPSQDYVLSLTHIGQRYQRLLDLRFGRLRKSSAWIRWRFTKSVQTPISKLWE